MWWVLGIIVGCLIAWGLLSATWVLYPERRAIPPPQPLPAYSSHEVTAPDGARFDVWQLDCPSPRGRVLVCHGYYANRHQVLAVADGLRRRGYQALLFELRGHGQRPGPCTLGTRERLDAEAVLRWAQQREASDTLPIGLLGFSMGGALTCQIAARSPGIRAIVTDSLYSHLRPIICQAIRQRYHLPTIPWGWVTWWSLQGLLRTRLDRLDPAALAPQLTQPLLAIQGGEDRRVDPRLGAEFYERWGGPKERWVESTVVHVGMFARDPGAYVNRVANFFDRVLTDR